jgi:hypothetical protein
VVNQALSKCSDELIAFASVPNLSQMLYKMRKVPYPKGDTSPALLVIPEEYKKFDGEQVLQWDSGPSHNRIVLLYTQRTLELLSKNGPVGVDGTFKTKPGPLWSQIYSIHTTEKGRFVPCAIALMGKAKHKVGG